MAAVIAIKNADGSRSYGASVSVKPFKRTWQSFGTRKEAEAWRDALTLELRKQRKEGGTRPDLATLTVAALNKAFLEDPDTAKLRYFPDLKRQLAWWTLKYGTSKV